MHGEAPLELPTDPPMRIEPGAEPFEAELPWQLEADLITIGAIVRVNDDSQTTTRRRMRREEPQSDPATEKE